MKLKTRAILSALTAMLFLSACNNFFHDLVPPDGNEIISFSIPGQLSADIGENTIHVMVAPGTEINGIIPLISVSPGATLLPVTIEYVSRALGDDRTFGAALELHASGGDMTNAVIEMIERDRYFNRPDIDIPINFGFPVNFLVISGQGSVRKYTVHVEIDTGEGLFRSFRFDKFFNPYLVHNAAGIINTIARTVTIDVWYPVENIADYKLIPTFATNTARVFLPNGTELRSSESLLTFMKPPTSADLSNPVYGTQEVNLTLRRAGFPDTQWTLIVNFAEDPNTIRSMIDFRFTRTRNPFISADAVAVITAAGDTGTIDVTVTYSGIRPQTLIPDFITPSNNVTVNGNLQTRGVTAHDFTANPVLLYVVAPNVGPLPARTYTVTVNLVSAVDPLPRITSFSFNTAQNPSLTADSTAMIDHNAQLIFIEAAYQGIRPAALIPSFAATGTVRVSGQVQHSGITGQNFSSPILYTVSNPTNPTLRRDYRVEVRFVSSLSAVAEITAFSFLQADNPELIADVHATINQQARTITATVLADSPGVWVHNLVPRFTVQGRVEVGNAVQTSGQSRQSFSQLVSYRAIADSGFWQDYTVQIRIVNSRIYVNQNAAGFNNFNNGASWQHAHRNLPDAVADTRLFYNAGFGHIPREVWIAQGTYANSNAGLWPPGEHIFSNTSLIGGFNGHESRTQDRGNPASNRATVRLPNYNIRVHNNAGLVRFEYLTFTDFFGTAVTIQNTATGKVIMDSIVFTNPHKNHVLALAIGNAGEVKITNSLFYDLHASTSIGSVGAISSANTSLTVTDTDFINVTAPGSFPQIMRLAGGTFINSRFIHNDTVRIGGRGSMFRMSGGTVGPLVFIGCSFENFRGSNPTASIFEKFIFDRFAFHIGSPGVLVPPHHPNTSYILDNEFDLTLRNNTFIFAAGHSMGLVALFGGGFSGTFTVGADNLLMDGNTIQNNGSTQPLIYLVNSYWGGSTPGVFRFRSNNIYNGTVLTTQVDIHGLGTSIRRRFGAVATMLP